MRETREVELAPKELDDFLRPLQASRRKWRETLQEVSDDSRRVVRLFGDDARVGDADETIAYAECVQNDVATGESEMMDPTDCGRGSWSCDGECK